MWYYKLVVSAGEIYYYDSNELQEAKADQKIYGGVIFDMYGKYIS